jgi:hypothetical protein
MKQDNTGFVLGIIVWVVIFSVFVTVMLFKGL